MKRFWVWIGWVGVLAAVAIVLAAAFLGFALWSLNKTQDRGPR